MAWIGYAGAALLVLCVFVDSLRRNQA